MAWAPDYVTAAQLKSYLNIQHDEDELWLANWATAVSRNVDDYCGRQFGKVDAEETRYYDPVWDSNGCKSYIEIDDLYDPTDLEVLDINADEVLAANYKLEPRNAAVKGLPYTRIVTDSRFSREMTFTSSKWGWSEVPASIPTAIYIQASRLAARRDSPFGVAGSPTDGSEIRLLAQLDPDFKTTLKPYIRKWFVA